MDIISAIYQWLIILFVAILPMALNIDAVRRLRRSQAPDNRPAWRHRAACAGAASNILVYSLPLTLLVQKMYLYSDQVFFAMNVLFVISVGLALVGPIYVRPQLLVGV